MTELAKAAYDDGDSAANNALRNHRPDLFGFFSQGTSTLHVAAGFASWDMVEILLKMGAATTATNIVGWDPLHTISLLGRADNCRSWCERFPGWDFEGRRATAVNATALALAVLIGGNKVETVKGLVKAGADPLRCTAHTGCTVLHNAAANQDCDEELMRYLLEIPGVRGLVNVQQRALTFTWKVKYLAARLFVTLGSKKAILRNVSEWPLLTPLITAARNGNAAAIKVLVVEGGANTSLRNARGRAAIDVLVGGENALEECRRLLRLG